MYSTCIVGGMYLINNIFEEKGFDSLLVNLSDKNKEYFNVVCESASMNKMSDQKGRAPC